MMANTATLVLRTPFGLTDASGTIREAAPPMRDPVAQRAERREWRIPTRLGDLVLKVEAPPAWFEPTLESMIELLRLEEDWDSYGAGAFEPQAIPLGLDLLRLTMSESTPIPLVVPAPRGGLQFEWHSPRYEIEVEVLPDGLLSYLFEDVEQSFEDEVEGGLSSIAPLLARSLAELTKAQ